MWHAERLVDQVTTERIVWWVNDKRWVVILQDVGTRHRQALSLSLSLSLSVCLCVVDSTEWAYTTWKRRISRSRRVADNDIAMSTSTIHQCHHLPNIITSSVIGYVRQRQQQHWDLYERARRTNWSFRCFVLVHFLVISAPQVVMWIARRAYTVRTSDGARCLEVGGTRKSGLTGGLSQAPYARVCKFGLITRPIFSNSGGYVPPRPLRGSVTGPDMDTKNTTVWTMSHYLASFVERDLQSNTFTHNALRAFPTVFAVYRLQSCSKMCKCSRFKTSCFVRRYC